MVGKIYKSCHNGRLYLVKRTISNLEKTRLFVEFYQITIHYQAVPSFDAGHYFPKRSNKNVTFIEPLEDFHRSCYEPTDEEMKDMARPVRLR